MFFLFSQTDGTDALESPSLKFLFPLRKWFERIDVGDREFLSWRDRSVRTNEKEVVESEAEGTRQTGVIEEGGPDPQTETRWTMNRLS